MGLFAGGSANKTNAINQIKAAINARISTQPDGSKVLDWPGLQEWLSQQAALVLSQDVLPANLAAAKGVLAAIDTNPDSQRLAAFIGRGNWENRSDWPSPLLISNGQAFVAAAHQAKSDLDRFAWEIENHYTQAEAALPDTLRDLFVELGVESRVPAALQRLIDTRFYVYTYVTDWGEESAPSPVTDVLELDQDDSVLITRTDTVPPGKNIVGWRLYRSNVGSQQAAFQLIAPTSGAGVVLTDGAFDYFSIATTTFTDNLKSTELQEVCPSTTWLEPPSKLRGLVGMPNGVMAGFFDNTVCFCEPFYPYAWPAEYQMTTEHPVVALGSFGQVLVVGHHGGVDYISGADSASMAMQKGVSLQACASARSMVSVEGAVIYASPDGLCLAGPNGVQLITANHFTREDWQALKPDSMVGAYHEMTYYFLWNNGVESGCYALHLETGKLTALNLTGSAFYTDTLTDRLYVAQGTNIVALFSGATYRTGKWKSKLAVMPKQTGFAWLTVESDFAQGPVTVKWYGDGALVHTATVVSRAPVRLPPGQYLEHEIEVTSASRWNSLTLASSGDELRGA